MLDCAISKLFALAVQTPQTLELWQASLISSKLGILKRNMPRVATRGMHKQVVVMY